MTDSTDTSAPTYARSLTRKERDDRNEQLLAQLKLKRELEPELAKAKLEAKRIVSRVAKQIETVGEMIDILAVEVETGHAHVPKQLELGSVPQLADADGNAVDDTRDEASAAGDDDDSDDDDDEPEHDKAELTDLGPDDEGEPGVRAAAPAGKPAKKRAGKASKKRRTSNGAARATA